MTAFENITNYSVKWWINMLTKIFQNFYQSLNCYYLFGIRNYKTTL